MVVGAGDPTAGVVAEFPASGPGVAPAPGPQSDTFDGVLDGASGE